MNYVEKSIEINNEHLILNNLRVIYWPSQKAVILSDLHIGKSMYFRKHGIPISSNVQRDDLKRLDFLISLYNVDKLIVVGDLFHSGHDSEIRIFKDWIEQSLSLDIHLIKGNHDRFNFNSLGQDQLIIYEKNLKISPFLFIHEPEHQNELFTISGHLHPGVRISSSGRPKITLPCFKLTNNNLILPAFSSFTGLATGKRLKGETYHAFTETSFFEF